jgi:hypothetical protein
MEDGTTSRGRASHDDAIAASSLSPVSSALDDVRGGFDSHPTSTFLCHRHHWRIGLREWLTAAYLGLQSASILLPAIASTASVCQGAPAASNACCAPQMDAVSACFVPPAPQTGSRCAGASDTSILTRHLSKQQLSASEGCAASIPSKTPNTIALKAMPRRADGSGARGHILDNRRSI